MNRDSSTSVCVARWTILDPPAAARTPAFATQSSLIDTIVLAAQVMIEDSLIDTTVLAAQVMMIGAVYKYIERVRIVQKTLCITTLRYMCMMMDSKHCG